MAKNFCDLTGKKAVVVGGAGAIGNAIAEALEQAGAQVLKSDIRDATGQEGLYIKADVSKEPEVQALVKATVEKLGTVDILVNAQGFNKKYDGTEIPVEIWDQMFDANVKSLMLTCKHFGKYMKENNIHGKIINLSSVRGIRAVGNGGNGNVGYCATKGAVEMLTKAYAGDLRPNIQVNAIGPTVTYTPMMVGILPEDPVERAKRGAAMPAMRIGELEDLQGPAVFLASSASDFITGSTIYPDGGLTSVG
jgi:gluconate 5-dehydrogenase